MKTKLLEARLEGEKQGRAEERRANASKMKADGMSLELISKYTGLTAEEILKL